MSDPYLLYGVSFSYYTAKARAYLIHKGLPYTEILSTVSVYKKILQPKTGVSVIPVVKTPDDQYLQDTAVIVDALENRHTDNPLKPLSPKQRLVSSLFEIWADEWLLLPAMHYRWNKDNFPYVYQQFGNVAAPWAPNWVKAFFGRSLGARFKGFVPKLGVTAKMIPAIESWYESLVLPALDQHFANHDYLLGARPCVGDCALMGPLYAHLFLDPVPGQLLRESAPNVCRWIDRMNDPSQASKSRDWLPDDAIPETLLPLLENQFNEFWPVLPVTVEALTQWRTSHPDKEYVPRMIGEHTFSIGAVNGARALLPFQQWKMQRVQETYRSVGSEAVVEVNDFLNVFSAQQYMTLPITSPLKRQGNRLIFSD